MTWTLMNVPNQSLVRIMECVRIRCPGSCVHVRGQDILVSWAPIVLKAGYHFYLFVYISDFFSTILKSTVQTIFNRYWRTSILQHNAILNRK